MQRCRQGSGQQGVCGSTFDILNGTLICESFSIGNFHLSPGRSFQSNAMHVHDLVPYLEGGQHHDFGHIIHKFSFGSETEQILQNNAETERLKKKLDISDPLTGVKAHTEESNYMFQYFLKVVSTRFETFDKKMLSTHQYSVTSYERDLSQGNAPTKGGGHTTTHGFAGVPGVFFSVSRYCTVAKRLVTSDCDVFFLHSTKSHPCLSFTEKHGNP